MTGLLGALLLVAMLVAVWFLGCISLISNGSPLKAIVGFVFPPYGMIVGVIQLLNEHRYAKVSAKTL